MIAIFTPHYHSFEIQAELPMNLPDQNRCASLWLSALAIACTVIATLLDTIVANSEQPTRTIDFDCREMCT